MLEDDKIPNSLIGLLSTVIPVYYPRAQIDALFLYAGTPLSAADVNKATAVASCLRGTNAQNAFPMNVLGMILDDFMEKQVHDTRSWGPATQSE